MDADKPNGEILDSSITMKEVTASTSGEEYGALDENAKIGVPLQNTLQEMVCTQKEIPLITNNSTGSGIMNKSTQSNKSRAMDMHFHWVIYRCEQKQFKVSWETGTTNLGD